MTSCNFIGVDSLYSSSRDFVNFWFNLLHPLGVAACIPVVLGPPNAALSAEGVHSEPGKFQLHSLALRTLAVKGVLLLYGVDRDRGEGVYRRLLHEIRLTFSAG